MKVSVVIPCYKSENSIESVVREIEQFFEDNNQYNFEIILINDYSPDNTLEVLKKIITKYQNVKIISFSKNFGQHAAIMAGLNKATGDIIICMDDDGQTPPHEMYKLIDKINEGYDVAYANYSVKKHSVFRNWGSKLNDAMTVKLINKPKGLYQSSYFAIRKYVTDEVVKYDNSYPYLNGLILRITKNMCNVMVEHREREHGGSTYTFKKLVSLWVNGFTAFSVTPLRVAGVVGLLMSFVGLLFSIYIIIIRLLDPSIAAGWSSIMATILIMNGIMLIFTGLIGEYIGRIYISANKSPQYVVKEEYDGEQ